MKKRRLPLIPAPARAAPWWLRTQPERDVLRGYRDPGDNQDLPQVMRENLELEQLEKKWIF